MRLFRSIGALPALAVLALLAGCSVTSIGAEGRAHREEAALHKLLDGQQSYAVVAQTMSRRGGYSCNDSEVEFNADRKTGKLFIPRKHGRVIVCSDNMDWNVPSISCSWSVHLYAEAIESDSVAYIAIESLKACN